MRPLAALLIVPIAGVAMFQSADESETLPLTIRITTMFGAPIEKARVTLVSVGPDQRYVNSSNNRGEVRFEVPRGLYDVDISLLGFTTRHERVGVYQSNLVYRLGLALAARHGEDRPEIRGTVSGEADVSLDRWVRLVSIYNCDLVESSVDSMGRFVLNDFPPGKYLLLLFERDKVVSMRELEVFGGVKYVNIARKND